MNKLILILLLPAFLESNAQEPLTPRESPLEMVTMKFENSYIKITYCRPSVNGREIFGNLVPYGEVWRTGANEATEITFTDDVLVSDQPVEAGTYSIYTIPDKNSWTFILNKDLGMWGAFSYNEDHDILRIQAKAETTMSAYEPFTIEFDQKGLPSTNILLMWEDTRVTIPVKLQ